MKLFLTVFAICFTLMCSGEVAEFGLRIMSVYQRGILKTSEFETPVEVFAKVDDALTVVLAGSFGKLASVKIKQGKVVEMKDSPFFSREKIERFFLPDVMLCAGYYDFFKPSVVHTNVDAFGRVQVIVVLDDFCFVEFFYSDSNAKFPQKTRITRKQYVLELETIKTLNKK